MLSLWKETYLGILCVREGELSSMNLKLYWDVDSPAGLMLDSS